MTLPTLSIPRRILLAALCLICLALQPRAAEAQLSYAPGPSFTSTVDLTGTRIQFSPSQRHQMFRQSDTIGISTTGTTLIKLMSITGSVLYTGAPKSFSALPVGQYFVETTGDRETFVVLPNDYAGSSYLASDVTDYWYSLDKEAQMQPAWVRGGGQWSNVQPQAGVWNWTDTDSLVAANPGRRIMLSAFNRPAWQTDDTQFVALYVEFLRRLAQRYAGQVYGIEIWNEPYDTNMPTPWNLYYDSIVKQGAAAIRAVAPNLKVYGMGFVSFESYINWFRYFQDSGAIAALDGVMYHDYNEALYPPDQDTVVDANLTIPRLDKKIRTLQGIVGTTKPILINEMGLCGRSALGITTTTNFWWVTSTMDWQRAMSRAIKYAVMYPAAGVIQLMPHVLVAAAWHMDENSELYEAEYADRGPYPKTSAFLMSQYWLNNATAVDHRSLGEQIFLYAWQRPNNTSVVFAWTLEGLSLPLKANSLSATDIFGTPISVSALGEMPILFQSNNADAAGLLAAVMSALSATPNLAPVIAPLDNQSVMQNQPLQFAVKAVDPDNDPLSYALSPLPAGASFNAATGQFNWTPSQGQLGSYPLTVTVTDARGLSSSTTTTITVLGNLLDGLLARWKLDETTGSVAHDAAGNNQGTLANFSFNANSGWVTDGQRQALQFDGVDDSVGLASSQLNLVNNFSIALWIKPQNVAGHGAVFTVRSGFPSGGGLRLFVDTNHLLLQGQTTAGSQAASFADGLQNGQWYHVVLVYDKSTIKSYINGVLQSSVNWGGDLVSSPSAPSRLGLDQGYAFKGLLDDVLVFQRTLAPSEVLAVYLGNQPPVLTTIGTQNVVVGQSLSFTVSATDPEGNPLTYTASNLPAGASFNASTQVFSWTPSSAQAGSYSVSFSVSDGSLSASQTVAITVGNVNRPPVLTAIGNKSVAENSLLGFTLSATDPDGDPLTYSASNLPSGASFNAATRSFSWTPSFAQAGNYSVSFAVSDGSLSAAETITITVSNVDRAPVLNAVGDQAVNTGQTLRFTISGSDADGDALSYSASGLPTGASFDPGTRTFSWTPGTTQAGNYSVSFTISDGTLTASRTITIAVGQTNRAPTLTAIGSRSVNENALLSFTISGSDPDGNALTYSASGLPSGATFDSANRSFNWTPTYSQAGSYNVTFAVSDGSLSASETVALTVHNVNRAPVLDAGGDRSVIAAQRLAFVVNGSDPDGDALTFAAANLPAGANFTPGTRAFAWTPSHTQVGDYSVTFTVSDGQLAASQTIAVHVTAPARANNTAPVLSPVDILTGVAGSPLSYTFTATDAENDPLTFDVTGQALGTLSTSGLFQWTPPAASGYDLTVRVSDGQLSSSQLIPLLVVDPRYDWLFGAKLYAPVVINNNIFACSFRVQGNAAVVFVWTRPGVVASAGPVAGMTRTTLLNQPVTSNALGSAPMVYQAGKRVSPRQALERVVAVIQP